MKSTRIHQRVDQLEADHRGSTEEKPGVRWDVLMRAIDGLATPEEMDHIQRVLKAWYPDGVPHGDDDTTG
jgi:hypothetical protein